MSSPSSWSIEPVLPIAAQLAQVLGDRIVRNALSPGSRISEAEVAAEHSVSRQPVREAFIKLAERGLLVVLPQRGTYVSRIDHASVLDARFLREAVEADIVRSLVAAPDASLVAELRRQIRAQRAAANHERFMVLDDLFHRTLAEGAGRQGVWRHVSIFKVQMDRVRFLALDRFPTDRLINQHARIADSIETGEPDAAEAAIRKHLRAILDDLPKIVDHRPEYFNLPAEDSLPSANSTRRGESK